MNVNAIETPVGPSIPLVASDEERMVRESVRGIASGFGPKYMTECCDRGEPPEALWDALSQAGFGAVNVPTEFGGGGLGMTGLAAVQEELARAGIVLLFQVVSAGIAASILVKHGTPEQQERWLPGIAAGTERLSFAVTEGDAGTNTHNLSTRARRRDDGTWVLSGQKTFISCVEHATAILVVARGVLDDGSLGLPLLFIVDVDAAGLTRQQIPTAIRWPDKQWTLFLDEVELTDERLIGGDVGGLAALFDGLNPERIMGAAGAVGTADRALELAAGYARERNVWGKPIGTHQAISHPLAKAKVETELARWMTAKACALYDAGVAGAGEAANIAKYAAAEAAIHAVDAAVQTHGGNGVTLEYGITDMWWGTRLARIAPVSAEMILNYVSEHSLGLPKSY